MTPRTRDEYLDLVDQAIFEIDEVLMCAADEGDPEDSEFSEMLPVFEQLSAELKRHHADILQGASALGAGKDLPFLPFVHKWKDRIPFHHLFAVLNAVYKQGLAG